MDIIIITQVHTQNFNKQRTSVLHISNVKSKFFFVSLYIKYILHQTLKRLLLGLSLFEDLTRFGRSRFNK
jgi:hypothetical protein